ncbi:hypothetical protein ACFY5A_08465 [Microbacterium sp. NPDC012755]|uniref:DUF7882 family protein n=1 Tax=Microbacterium sp. NPDC012755 TaxID=3364184 RepID=UPI0036C67D1B
MGRLKYDGTSGPIPIDDVTLAHVKIVISTKLRRQESFMLTWRPEGDGPDARMTIWIHPAIPLQFGFDHAEIPALDPSRVTAMMNRLNASGELNLDQLDLP